MLDDVVQDRWVVRSACDHHTTWASSKALQMADINRATPFLDGTFVRDLVTGDNGGTQRIRRRIGRALGAEALSRRGVAARASRSQQRWNRAGPQRWRRW